MARKVDFSQTVSVFHNQHLPEQDSQLAGYSALIHAYALEVPLPSMLCAISKKHKKYKENNWYLFTPRHTPANSLYGHLGFALKYEGIDLSVLKALFDTIKPEDVVECIKLEPNGAYSRRIWFLYEWLQNTELNLTNLQQGNFVDVLDTRLQYPGPSRLSKRHRVRNNLPGVQGFCPTIRKTETLDQLINLNLAKHAQKKIAAIHPDLLTRAAAFLLLKDSKASYAIEGESPPHNRAERWGKAIGQAGLHPLTHEEFLRLQDIIIADFRFTHRGYRTEGGFIGLHDRATNQPIPDHISARWQDITSLIEGLLATNTLLEESDFDPILMAASIAFGFVFIHPLEDGNGRIHRYLIHHILAKKQFTSKGIVFPVSSAILNNIDRYRQVLEAYSNPRLSLIKWRPTEKGNIEVLNETINLYRYFDATQQAEFLYQCIQETIEKTLPEEVSYLQKYDELKQFISHYLDMPDRRIDLLIQFLRQKSGKLSNRAKKREFNLLAPSEIKTLEEKYRKIFLK